MRVLTIPEQLESEVQRAVMAFYRTFGIEVIRFSERRRTRVTPGWPDLGGFILRRRQFFLHEVKKRGGKQSAEQSAVQQWAEACNVPYICGGVQSAQDFLTRMGLIEP